MTDVLAGKFGKYTVEELLLEGDIANLYRARHRKLGQVALKVLHEALVEDEEILHRFWREMRLPEKLDHPQIVRVVDSGVVGDRCYLAMEWFDGDTVRTLLEGRGPLAPAEASDLMKPVLDALHHAHRAGMIHRNLKPENIMLDDQGRPHVAEFSLAKHLDGTVQLTRSGDVFGTPWYMAPEQIRSTSDVGMAADLYAAGAILYELVTGVTPFDAGDPLEVASMQVKGVPWAPSAHRGGISREFDLVILKALEKNPYDRFQDAASMRKALEFAEVGKKTGIQLVSPVRWPSRSRRTLVVAALVLAGGWGVWSHRHALPGLLPGGGAPPAPTAAAPATPRDAVGRILEELLGARGEALDGSLEAHRDAIGALDPEERTRLAEGLRRVAASREDAGALVEAVATLKLAHRIHRTPEVHRDLARVLRALGEEDQAAWHAREAANLGGS